MFSSWRFVAESLLGVLRRPPWHEYQLSSSGLLVPVHWTRDDKVGGTGASSVGGMNSSELMNALRVRSVSDWGNDHEERVPKHS